MTIFCFEFTCVFCCYILHLNKKHLNLPVFAGLKINHKNCKIMKNVTITTILIAAAGVALGNIIYAEYQKRVR